MSNEIMALAKPVVRVLIKIEIKRNNFFSGELMNT